MGELIINDVEIAVFNDEKSINFPNYTVIKMIPIGFEPGISEIEFLDLLT